MKNLLISCFLLSFLLSCQNNALQDAELTNKIISADVPVDKPGVVPVQDKIYTILHHADNYTWKDLDHFYRNDIQAHKNEPFYANLKKMAIIHLVNQFGLLENADTPTIEYYTNEQLSLDLIEPSVFLKCLNRLKNVWDREKLAGIAKNKYDATMSFIDQHLKEPEAYLKNHGDSMEQIRLFASSL